MTALGFRFARVAAADLPQCFELRHEVFCGESGILPESRCRDGIECDHYDDHSIHLGAYDHGDRLVGTSRIVKPPRSMPLPMFVHCTPSNVLLPKGVALGEVAEVSRMAISHARIQRAVAANRHSRKRSAVVTRFEGGRHAAASRQLLIHQTCQVFLGLLGVGYQESKRAGIKCWLAAMEVAMHRRLKRAAVDFERAGPAFEYHGMVHPYVLSVESFESAARQSTASIFSEATFREAMAGEEVSRGRYPIYAEQRLDLA